MEILKQELKINVKDQKPCNRNEECFDGLLNGLDIAEKRI
jgi:hypothetical protein